MVLKPSLVKSCYIWWGIELLQSMLLFLLTKNNLSQLLAIPLIPYSSDVVLRKEYLVTMQQCQKLS